VQYVEVLMYAVGFGRFREAYGSTDGADRIHGEAHQINARQVLPHPRARTCERKLLVRAHASAFHATWYRTREATGAGK